MLLLLVALHVRLPPPPKSRRSGCMPRPNRVPFPSLACLLLAICFISTGCSELDIYEHRTREMIGISAKDHAFMMREAPMYRDSFYGANYQMRVEALIRRTSKQLRDPRLQRWANAAIADSRFTSEWKMPSDLLPDNVAGFDPPLQPTVIVHPSSCLRMEWRGAWCHSGVIISARSDYREHFSETYFKPVISNIIAYCTTNETPAASAH
jgi:hypothetical protein